MAIRSSVSLTLTLASALMLGACSIANPLTKAEEEVKSDLDSANYFPATREVRNNIETQPLFAQAAFWGREYDLNPSDLESAIKLAAAVRKLGNAQRAIEITQTTRALYPKDPYLTAEYAASLIAAERALDAMKPLDEALRLSPNYARLWSLKGAALDQTEQYDLARKHYDRALRISPRDPKILANLGLSYALSGDPISAEKWLRQASALPGAGAGVHQNLALVLQLQGKTEEAERLTRLSQGDQKLPPKAEPIEPISSSSSAHYSAPPQQGPQSGQGPNRQVQTYPSQTYPSQTYSSQNYPSQNYQAQNYGAGGPVTRAPQTQTPYRPSAAPSPIPSSAPSPIPSAQGQRRGGGAILPRNNALDPQQRNVLNQIAGDLRPQIVPRGQNPAYTRQTQTQGQIPNQRQVPNQGQFQRQAQAPIQGQASTYGQTQGQFRPPVAGQAPSPNNPQNWSGATPAQPYGQNSAIIQQRPYPNAQAYNYPGAAQNNTARRGAARNRR